jgi:hypothetical protein
MIKQFLFLCTGIFAGITAYGQAVPGSAPAALLYRRCFASNRGKPYTYQARPIHRRELPFLGYQRPELHYYSGWNNDQ